MTALAQAVAPRTWGPTRAARIAASPVAAAFLVSRLLVLLAGALGSAMPHDGWRQFDPAGTTAALGPIGRILAGAAMRWDAVHYLDIAAHGYHDAASAAFFPLLPLLVRATSIACGSPVLAGMLVALVAFAVALELLRRLTALELGERTGRVTVWLLALSPLAFFFSAVYTESLFLALSLGCFLALRTDRWRTACALAALAALTRVTGIVLLAPLALEWWPRRRERPGAVLWTLLVPAALCLFLGLCAAKGYGFLAPFAQQTGSVHSHTMTGPVGGLLAAVRAAASGVRTVTGGGSQIFAPSLAGVLAPPAQNVLLFALLLLAGACLVAVVRRLPPAYAIYAAGCLVVCVSSPVTGRPLISLDRYALTIFPLWMVAAHWLRARQLDRVVTLVSAALLVLYAAEFAAWAFVA